MNLLLQFVVWGVIGLLYLIADDVVELLGVGDLLEVLLELIGRCLNLGLIDRELGYLLAQVPYLGHILASLAQSRHLLLLNLGLLQSHLLHSQSMLLELL